MRPGRTIDRAFKIKETWRWCATPTLLQAWAIDFYCRNGFTIVENSEKDRLLKAYWSIPERQIQTSVVLADRRWVEGGKPDRGIARRS